MTTKTDLSSLADEWLRALEAALARGDADAAAKLFQEDGFWRDLVALTWNIATFEGRAAIGEMLEATKGAGLSKLELVGEATEKDGYVEAWFAFETAVGRGRGHLRVKDGRAWTLLTALQELKGMEEPAGPRRPEGVEHRAMKNRPNWAELRAEEEQTLGYTVQPYCLIVGGSQGGLALGARLKRLGVPTLIIDALPRPGDAWRNRYKSLHLHDPIWIDHLPYIPFPDHWPVYTPKDRMGEWLEIYAKAMELNFWGSTTCRNARYDEERGEWVVSVEREGKLLTLRPKQFVLATGLSGIRNMPSFPGQQSFKGVQHHSGDHPGGEAFSGRRCVVVGGNNSAHDICADLWEYGCDVTMIQRSPTTVIKASALRQFSDVGPYSEIGLKAGITTDIADLMVASLPYKIRTGLDKANTDKIRAQNAEFYERLAASGFLLDFGEDDTGLMQKYLRRASGYYIDVGASDLIIQGEVKVRSGVGVASITEDAVILTDGSRVPADVIVYATGYGPMDGWAAKLISPEVAQKVGRCWGLGSGATMDPGPWEGELRNMWKPTAQEGLWFHGGNLAQSRFHSLHLALQIKARQAGLETPVYPASGKAEASAPARQTAGAL